MPTHTKPAVWRAVNSDQGDRLVQIDREQTALDRKISDIRKLGTNETIDILYRLTELRAERETIIQQHGEA